MTGFCIVYGASTAIDTLCAQAFGHKAFKRIGIILQQAIFTLGLSIFPILALWLNMESLLNNLNQDSCVVRLAAQYIRIFSAALPFVLLFMLLSKYLQAQSIVMMFIIIGFVTNALNIMLHAIFLYGYDLGFVGAVLAMTLTQSSAPLFLLVYMWAWGLHKQTWGGWSWESLVDWWTFTKLAIPGFLMMSLKWWSFELGIIVVGMIGKTELAIYTISVNISIFLFLIAMSISFAATIRVGNELGAGNPKGAKRVFCISLILGVCEALVLAVALQALKYQIGIIFTKDEMVIEGLAQLMYVFPFCVIFDHIQCTLGGILRGCGQQLLGASLNFVCFYVIGLPISVSLALVVKMDATGFWVGLLCGSVIQSVTFLVVLVRLDWEKEAKKAIEKARLHVSEELGITLEEMQKSTTGTTGTTGTTSQSSQKITIDAETTPLHNGRKSDGCKCFEHFTSSKAKLVLYRGSFLVIGVAILVAGGVGSHFKLSFAEGNTTNASSVCSEVTTMMFNVGYPEG
ncbi:hypothetical protein EMCRGX_G028116 [Ephydatia muelleri]